MVHFSNSQNITWDYAAIGYWSSVEVHTGIIFACLPAICSLQYRVFPKSHSLRSQYTNAYASRSRLESPFPSVAKHTRCRTRDYKSFNHLDTECQPGEGIASSKRAQISRGVTRTEIQCGSVHTEDDTELLPIHRKPAFPRPTFARTDHLSDGVRQKGSMLRQGIKVKTGYTVTVESGSMRGSPARSVKKNDRRSGK